MMMKSSGESMGLPSSFTAIPNALIDEVMPTLKDTEWRLLCVVARQTIGWMGKDRKRKQHDWISQSQLIAKTGRNSAALSAALDVLVRENLIVCQAENGELLNTPQQRRRHRGRVYFSLALERIQTTKSEIQKANRTKEKENKRNSLHIEETKSVRLYSGWSLAGEVFKSRYDLKTRVN